MTLNLLFRYPDLYRTGMAVAPVPDMRLYDTIYQERYMGLPQDNAEDYQKGSPITHAAGLKGNLLIVHGTGDDNVPLPGDREAREQADRTEQAVHADGLPEPQPFHRRGEEHDPALVRTADPLPQRQLARRPEAVKLMGGGIGLSNDEVGTVVGERTHWQGTAEDDSADWI